jgi:hypothetical protein
MSEEDEKQTKLSEHIVKSIVQPISEKQSFTTEAKSGRRKPNKTSVTLERAKLFMEHLWSKGLKECSYETLEYEFIQCYGTNEHEVLEKYLGKPKRTIHYGGCSVVRLNKVNGKVAHFEYQNTRTIQHKKGLLEILGFVTQEEGGRFILNHSCFPYCKKQISIDNFSLGPIEAGERKATELRDRGEKKEEEEVIEPGEKFSLEKIHTKSLTFKEEKEAKTK